MTDLKAIQRDIIELLVEIDHICRKHGIVYYLSGGSLLGALRHRGFIPWDDDADINMTRDNYEKFEAVIDQELRPDRELLSYSRFPSYRFSIPRYTKLNSTNLVVGRMADECPHGLFIDIVIMDPMPKDEPELSEWKKDHYAYHELLEYPYIMSARKCNWDSVDVDRYLKYKKQCETDGEDHVLHELEKKIFSVPEEDADHYCMRFGNVWLGVMPKEWFGDPIELPFDGQMFYAPSQPEEEMCLFYGLGWKAIPSRMPGHLFNYIPALDSGNCEREFFNLVDPEYFRMVVDQYFELFVKYHDSFHKIFRKVMDPYFKLILVRLENAVEKNGGFDFLIENARREGLAVFREYFALQILPGIGGNKIFMELPEKYVYPLFEILFQSGRIAVAEILSKLYLEMGSENLRDMVKDYHERAALICDLVKATDRHDLDEMHRLMSLCDERDKEQIPMVKAKMICGLSDADNDREINDLLDYIDSKREMYPTHGEILKLYGDALYASGRITEALESYHNASYLTNNGLVLLELSDKGVDAATDLLEAAGTDEWISSRSEFFKLWREALEEEEEKEEEEETDSEGKDVSIQ